MRASLADCATLVSFARALIWVPARHAECKPETARQSPLAGFVIVQRSVADGFFLWIVQAAVDRQAIGDRSTVDAVASVNDHGQHAFLDADRVENWIVLHGGATAV